MLKYVENNVEKIEEFDGADDRKKVVRNVRRRKNVDQNSIEIYEDQFVEHFLAVIEKADEGDHYISFRAIAEELGVRYQQVYQRCFKQNKLRVRTINKKYYGCYADVKAWKISRQRYFESRARK
jgi:valyl-tRNA synthetase